MAVKTADTIVTLPGQTMAIVAVETLQPGDLVDLQNDAYADPDGENLYDYAYAEVHEIQPHAGVLGIGVICVDFIHDGGEVRINFPVGHLVVLG